MKKVLIVDDMLYVRKIIAKILSIIRPDWETHTADNDEDAMNLAETLKPDLITLDLTVPGMGGENLITKLLEISPESSVCVISALNYQAKIDEMLGKGARWFQPKPLRTEDLEGICQQVES